MAVNNINNQNPNRISLDGKKELSHGLTATKTSDLNTILQGASQAKKVTKPDTTDVSMLAHRVLGNKMNFVNTVV